MLKIRLASVRDKKLIVGLALAAVCVVLGALFFSIKYCLVFACIFVIAAVVRIEIKNRAVAAVLYGLWGIGCLLILCGFSPLVGKISIDKTRMLLNFLCVFSVTALCWIITGRWRLSVCVSCGLLEFLAVANALVYQTRSKELLPLDFLSFGTAMNVVDQYKLTVTNTAGHAVILMIAALFAMVVFQTEKKKIPRCKVRMLAVVVCLASVLSLGQLSRNYRIMTFSTMGSANNGYYLNFYLSLKQAFIRAPEGYSGEALEQLADRYGAAGDQAQDGPNIIVIMNESFADLRVFGELSTNIPVTPFIDSLKENTVKGFALASVYGGNTASSEFEFLTGHSMAFLPEGAVAYQQYIRNETYSLAWLMDSWGYTCKVTHPFLSSGWSRTRVYPWFGFGSYSFEEAYPKEDIIRDYISDREMYGYILEQLDQKEADEKLFLFGITMQNHGAYGYVGENYTQTVELVGYEGEFPQAEQYLSLIHESDKAVEYLLTALEDHPEDTIVLFFGDHFPGVEDALYAQIYGKELQTLDEQMLRYKVPFFIWSNFEMEEKTVELTSINYLSRYLLECAGFQLPAYYQLLAQTEKTVPALNAYSYYSAEAGCFKPLSEASPAERQILQEYQILQYNNLFDAGHRSRDFFGKYIP